MASRDAHSSYVDGIKVKISEKYKPPPRIILPVSYSQRLTMNDQIRRTMPQYDFNGERSIKSSLAEWKIARNLKQEERVSNFEACSKEVITIDQLTAATKEETFKKEQEEMKVASDYNMTIPSITTQIQHNILIPTIAGLNPQPHSSMLDKSPFNVYDFDPDTSSPFDNMALKSINDLEELALVLNRDKGALGGKSQQLQHSNQQQTYQMYNYNEQQNAALTSYSNKNGYYQHDVRSLTQPSVNVNHSYSYPPGSYDQHLQHLITSTTTTQPSSQSSVANLRSTQQQPPQSSQQPLPSTATNQLQHRTVPLIMRSIQQQLDNTRSSTSHSTSLGVGNQVEQLDNPFASFEADAQAMCTGISSMGFPLERVARACDLIGRDDKKIVEYLLVMSDLMDLGFSETSVSTALVKCNNEKDKALEELLTS